jgi:hypothetical protein
MHGTFTRKAAYTKYDATVLASWSNYTSTVRLPHARMPLSAEWRTDLMPVTGSCDHEYNTSINASGGIRTYGHIVVD